MARTTLPTITAGTFGRASWANAVKGNDEDHEDRIVDLEAVPAGTGDVVGPASATDNAIARFNATTGKLLQNSAPVVQDDGRISTVTDPTGPQDVATKQYVDDEIAGVGAGSAIRTVGMTIDGGGVAITTGVKGFVRVPYSGTITKVTLLSTDAAATAGSIVVDVWKDVYTNYPPTVADTITASAKPTLSSANKAEDATLTGWTTSVTAGDVFGFKVDSATTVTRVVCALEVTT